MQTEIIFNRKTKKMSHLLLRFNDSILSQTLYQKRVGIFPDARLIFEEHLKIITTKIKHRTITEIAKKNAKTGANDHVQSFCETTPRLSRRLAMKLITNHLIRDLSLFSIMLAQPYRDLLEDCQGKNFKRIGFGIPPM